MLRNFLMVGFGGAVGSMARYGVAFIVSRFWNSPFPAGTFLINILGSLIIGMLFGLASRNSWLQQGGMLLMATGFCGGFTTFSSFAMENVHLLGNRQSFIAITYISLSIIIGLLLCRVGIWLTN